MSENISTNKFGSALQDFRAARRKADLEQVMALLTGKSTDLLSYEEVRKKLHARNLAPRGLQDIPLDAIVGSVGRYTDFTRTFLPKHSDDEARWARVFMVNSSMSGLPPIEVYQVGTAYFVKDGNHRVSVARQMNATYIQAYVTEVQTKIPITPDTDVEELLLKADYVNFLDHTHIDELRPEANLTVTLPGQYDKLKEHIDVHRYFMGIDEQRDITYEESVIHWYDVVYMPVVEIIRERGLLRDFSNRTEVDLYIWIMEHRVELENILGWEIDPERVALHLASKFSKRPERLVSRMSSTLLDAVTPESLESGPRPGEWRETQTDSDENTLLFTDILVSVSGEEPDWQALEQAIIIAKRENGRLYGLHVVPENAQKESQNALAIQQRFDQRCQDANVPGNLVIEAGSVSNTICDRSRWVDLAVVKLNYPPASQPIARLGSGFRSLIHRCPRPILAVPHKAQALGSALLAYDGSPKSREGLFIAAYIAGSWGIPLVVLTVMESDRKPQERLLEAETYLTSHNTRARYIEHNAPVPEAILETADKYKSDLIIMGGYGFTPLLDAIMGSAVDQVLRESHHPILICR